jgi:hypothetical protein
MDRHMLEALDAHLTGQHEDNEPEFCTCPNLAGDCDGNHCEHAYVSWHGSRGECQDCGEIISAVNPETDAILTKLFDQWRDDITKGHNQ